MKPETTFSYFVVGIRYDRDVEAIVNPEITRREVISRIASGEYQDVAFIHYITMNDVPQDVTRELLDAGALLASDNGRTFDRPDAFDAAEAAIDRIRDYRKHEAA